MLAIHRPAALHAHELRSEAVMPRAFTSLGANAEAARPPE